MGAEGWPGGQIARKPVLHFGANAINTMPWIVKNELAGEEAAGVAAGRRGESE